MTSSMMRSSMSDIILSMIPTKNANEDNDIPELCKDNGCDQDIDIQSLADLLPALVSRSR